MFYGNRIIEFFNENVWLKEIKLSKLLPLRADSLKSVASLEALCTFCRGVPHILSRVLILKAKSLALDRPTQFRLNSLLKENAICSWGQATQKSTQAQAKKSETEISTNFQRRQKTSLVQETCNLHSHRICTTAKQGRNMVESDGSSRQGSTHFPDSGKTGL